AALAERSRLVEAVREWAAACDAILTPPAPGEAPGLETTGDPRLSARWTLVGAPAISVPAGWGPAGLPLGLQLCGAPGEDRALLGAAAWVERALGRGSIAASVRSVRGAIVQLPVSGFPGECGQHREH